MKRRASEIATESENESENENEDEEDVLGANVHVTAAPLIGPWKSWDDFHLEFAEYQNRTFQKFTIRNSLSVKSENKDRERRKKGTLKAPAEMKHLNFVYWCTHGIKRQRNREEKQKQNRQKAKKKPRPLQHYRFLDCMARFTVAASIMNDGKGYEVILTSGVSFFSFFSARYSLTLFVTLLVTIRLLVTFWLHFDFWLHVGYTTTFGYTLVTSIAQDFRHCHYLNERVYQSYATSRKIPDALLKVKENAMLLLNADANKRFIQAHVKEHSGVDLTPKDLDNMRVKQRQILGAEQDQIKKVLDEFQRQNGFVDICTTEVNGYM